jgi:molybdopterin-guanine dinucleotide biosynthesis protein A
MTVHGRRIIDRVLDALRDASDIRIIIANDPHADRWAPGVRTYPDAYAARGALAGIHAALRHAGTPVVVVAWDMPFVSSALLRELRRTGEAANRPVVPMSARGVEPCCAYYTPDCLAVAARALERGELRLEAFVNQLENVVRFDMHTVRQFGDPDTLFCNVNDAAELAAAERRHAGTALHCGAPLTDYH